MKSKSPSIAGALNEPLFRFLWVASLVSNVGTWMQNTAATWLMLSFSASSINLSLMQTASTIPALLVSIPASALADLVNRRKLVLIIQGFMFGAASLLSLCSFFDLLNPFVLLFFTFLLGVGSAMNNPVWQAITPDIISVEHYTAGIALNGVAINIARAVGPAISGILVGLAGVKAVFVLNAFSFIAVIYSVYLWKPTSHESTPQKEHFLKAVKEGFTFVRHSTPYKIVLIRAAAFILSGSAIWALLPAIAKAEFNFSANGYGIMVGCLGVGSLAGALLLPTAMSKFRLNSLIIVASALYAAAIFLLVRFPVAFLAYGLLTVAGISWIFILSILNIEAQKMAPSWVRARALGVYTVVFQGGMGVASLLWGILASKVGVDVAVIQSAAGIIVGIVLTMRFRIEQTPDASGQQVEHKTTLIT